MDDSIDSIVFFPSKLKFSFITKKIWSKNGESKLKLNYLTCNLKFGLNELRTKRSERTVTEVNIQIHWLVTELTKPIVIISNGDISPLPPLKNRSFVCRRTHTIKPFTCKSTRVSYEIGVRISFEAHSATENEITIVHYQNVYLFHPLGSTSTPKQITSKYTYPMRPKKRT